MVKPALLALIVVLGAAAAGCGRFQDPNVVVDLRTLAMRADPPDQVIDVDLTQPVMPAALLAQLVPTRVCALVADPAADRRLLWSMTLCSLLSTDRCDDDGPELLLGMGLSGDPETTVPEPGLCVTVMPDANLLALLAFIVEGDALHGLGGIDYGVVLRVGGENGNRDLDQYAAKTLRVTLQPAVDARRVADFEHAFATIAGAHPNALVVLPDRLLLAHRRRIVDFAAHNRLPAMYPYREYVDDGGFMSYGTRYTDLFRAAATFVDKILKGMKPADIPVQQATNFEFIINLKTARALGLTIPPSLLGRADEVIQ